MAVAVWRKFVDDRASMHAALIAYYAFLSLFPLRLALVSVSGWSGVPPRPLSGGLGPTDRSAIADALCAARPDERLRVAASFDTPPDEPDQPPAR